LQNFTLENKKVVVLGSNLFGDFYEVGLFAFLRFFLQKKATVLYIAEPLSLPSLLLAKYRGEKMRRFFLFAKGGRKEGERLIQVTSLTFYHHRLPNLLVKPNAYKRLVFPKLNYLLKKLEFSSPDIVLFDASPVIFFLKEINARFKIYRMNDEISSFTSYPTPFLSLLESLEKESIIESDLVLPAHSSLFEKARRLRGSERGIFLIKNGVWVKRFEKIGEIPEELRRITPPRVVYVGSIRDWFDMDLLFFLAESLKDVSFVIIGPPPRKKRHERNIFFLGGKPHQLIPTYLHYCDCGIVPFKRIPLVEAMDVPIKVIEYLASSLPVVTIYWRRLEKEIPFLLFSKSKEDFLLNLRRALEMGKKEEYRNFAFSYSWEKNFILFDKLLRKLFNQSSSCKVNYS